MSVMRVSNHAALRQLLRQLPFAAIVCSLALCAAGCHSDSGDAAAVAPGSPAAQAANAGAAAGAPPSVSAGVQAQIDASRKAQAAAFASHYRSGPTGPVK